jgi:hypothetical protein
VRTIHTPLLRYTAAAAVALAVGWALGLGVADLIVLPVALVLLGLFKDARAWNERRRRRAVADAWLRSGGRPQHFEWRADELTSAHERRILARSLRSVVRELGSPPMRRSTVPLNRKALTPHADELRDLAELLDELDHTVTPAGILELQQLLTSPGSPIHRHAPEADVSESLRRIRRKLEAC